MRLLLISLLLLASAHAARPAENYLRTGTVRILPTQTGYEAIANGRSEVLIRAECRETATGVPVPDGTAVLFVTDLGDLATDRGQRQTALTVETRNGLAQVYASSDEVGTATITINVHDSRNFVVVDFVAEGSEARGRADVVTIKGASISYSQDYGFIEGWDARVKHRGLDISAEHLMIDIESEDLRARTVTCQRGDNVLDGEDAYYSFMTSRGVLRRFTDDGIERVLFSGATLEPINAETWQPPESPFEFDDRETTTWVVAKSMQLVLRRKLIIHRGSIWVQGSHILNLPPHHILGLAGYQGTTSRLFQINSQGGLSIDAPWILKASSGETRTVRLIKGTTGDSMGVRRGWHFGLDDTWETEHAIGKASLTGLLQRDPDFQLSHYQILDMESSANFYLGAPGMRGVLADAGYSRYHGGRHFNARINSYYFPETGLLASAEADLTGSSKPIGNTGLFRRFGTGLAFRTQDYRSDGPVLEHETSVGINTRSLRLGPKLRLRPSADGFLTWDTEGRVRELARFALGADYAISNTQRLGVRYSLDRRWGDYLYSGAGLHQTLGFNYNLFGLGPWEAFLTGSLDLTTDALYGVGSVSYQFTPKYRFSVYGNLYRYSSTSFTDLDFTVWRALGQQEIGLRWSTTDDRLSLQFGGLGF